MSNRAGRRHPERHRIVGPKQGGGPGSVAVGYCHPHMIDAAFHTAFVLMLLYDADHGQHIVPRGSVIELSTGPRIAAARNTIMEAFRNHPYKPEWFLSLDTDMTFTPDVLEQMLAVADPETCPILGGLCFIGGRGAKVEPTLRVVTDVVDGVPQLQTAWDYPTDSLVKIDSTGAACVLIHRSVVETLHAKYGHTKAPYFAETHTADGLVEFGEDVTFFLRCRQENIPVHVHTGIPFGHVKPNVIDEDSYLIYRRSVAELGEEATQLRALQRMGIARNVVNDVAVNGAPVEVG